MSKSILVFGATGTVGSGVVKRFLLNIHSEYQVIAPVRGNPDKLLNILGDNPEYDKLRLSTPSFNYSELKGCLELRDWVQDKFGTLDHVFAACGQFTDMTKVSDILADNLIKAMHSNVLPQIYFAQTFIPLLKEDPASSYSVCTGHLGEKCDEVDWALTTIADSACFGVCRGLDIEHKAKAYRVNEYRIMGPVHQDNDESRLTEHGYSQDTIKYAKFYDLNVVSSSRKGEIIKCFIKDIESYE